MTPPSPVPPPRAQNTYQPVRGFFRDILHTRYRAATDVYAFMFLADVVDFIIIIFGFWAFGVSWGGALRGGTRLWGQAGLRPHLAAVPRNTRRPPTSPPRCRMTKCPRLSW